MDNERERFKYGFDAGIIIDGDVVVKDDGRVIIVDDDSAEFSITEHLKSLEGKKVRLTVISIDSIQAIESMLYDSTRG